MASPEARINRRQFLDNVFRGHVKPALIGMIMVPIVGEPMALQTRLRVRQEINDLDLKFQRALEKDCARKTDPGDRLTCYDGVNEEKAPLLKAREAELLNQYNIPLMEETIKWGWRLFGVGALISAIDLAIRIRSRNIAQKESK